MTTSVERGVYAALARLCGDHALFRGVIRADHSIVDELGVDSILLVDLVVLLQKETGVRGLPMTEWTDREAGRVGGRFTVQSLVDLVEGVARARGLVD